MTEDVSKYKSEIEYLKQQNKLLSENFEKYTQLNDLFSTMLKLPDLESIYKLIVSSLHKNIPKTIILLNIINEPLMESRLIDVAGIDSPLLKKVLSVAGFNPIGKAYKLIPEHHDYCRTGKLVEFKGGLAQFSASELSPIIAQSLEKLIGLQRIHTIGIIKDDNLLATIHFFSFSKTAPIDTHFIETLVKQAGIIIQKKIAEIELRESEIRFKALHNASFGGIAIHDNGLILDCNQGLSEMSGYAVNELIGINGLDLISEETRHIVISHLSKASEEIYEVVGVRKNGSHFPVCLQGRNIPYKGKMVRSVEFRDITDQKKNEIELLVAKEKAEESDRLKSAFLANMSHEIRTPMNGILGFASLLKNHDLSGEEQQEYFSIIEKSGERMLNIINDLVNISKVESGLMELSYSKTHIKEQLDYLLHFFYPEAKQKNLELSINYLIPEFQSIIYTDREKLYAILTNLIKNAIKFTHKGSIEFGCQFTGTTYEFFVTDTGIGISYNKQKSVFERFVQAEVHLSRRYEGAGLGLSISKAYVEMLGGKIWLKSEPDVGTSFYFTIPADTQKINEDQFESGFQVTKSIEEINATILLVEDDQISQKYLLSVLRGSNLNILIAETGAEAVDLCRRYIDIQLVLMDIKLPDLDGYSAAQLIRKFRPDIPIIAQTAFALDKENQKFESSFNAYITKPIKAEEIKQMIMLFLS